MRGSRAAPPNTRLLAENAENVSCDLIATSLSRQRPSWIFLYRFYRRVEIWRKLTKRAFGPEPRASVGPAHRSNRRGSRRKASSRRRTSSRVRIARVASVAQRRLSVVFRSQRRSRGRARRFQQARRAEDAAGDAPPRGRDHRCRCNRRCNRRSVTRVRTRDPMTITSANTATAACQTGSAPCLAKFRQA